MSALIAWGLALLSVGAAGAAEVLLPPATPLTVADEQVAEVFYRQVVAAALQTGLSVEDADSIRTWALADAEGCFDNPDCPALLWSRTEARLAMIVRVGKGSSGLLVETRWVDVSGEVRRVARETVPYGKEASYAGRLALMLQEVQAGMPAAPGSAVTGLAGAGPGPAGTPAGSGTEPVPAPRVVIQPAEPVVPAAPPAGEGAKKPAEPPPNRYRLPKVVYDSMVAAVQAGKSEQQWMVENRVRSGRLTLQISGGMGFGDVSRGYLVDAQLKAKASDQDAEVLAGQASWEGATSGVGFSGFVAIGYSPLWYLDLSMSFGMLYGQKHLTVTTTDTACSGCEPEVAAYDPQAGVQALIEPRLRLLPLATGVAKPYLLAGLDVRIYDGFDVPDDGLGYRNAPGGMGLAPSFGGGLYIDALPDVSFFIEVPYTMVVPAAGVSRTDPEVPTAPAAMEHMGGFVRALAGLEVRL